ncbi:MAG: TonB-dependent receptor plug domain-containing protein, partial [Phycisphaerales bacterium]
AAIGEDIDNKKSDVNDVDDLFEMSIEELMEMPIVISASRQEQEIAEASVPISIITAEDIHYSGLKSIPEILRFVPGVDVLRADRNRYAVSIRGLHDAYSDRTLVLIDGLSAYSSIYGGAEWYRFPILIEDIKRIEVVRGPGGAAWGANAFNGVINIITKEPEDVSGYFGSTTINEFGDTYSHLRWAEKKGKLSWRTSLGYQDHESSDDAGAGRYESLNPALNTTIGFDSYSARDFSRNWVSDTKVLYRLSDKTKVSFGIGHSNNSVGNWELGGSLPKDDNRFETTRLSSRIDTEFPNGSSGYLQWFGNLERTSLGSHIRYRNFENTFEGQLNLKPINKHHISIGGNIWFAHISSSAKLATHDYAFQSPPYDEQMVGLFVIDRFEATDRLAIEGQIRGDWYSETQTDWSARLTGLYALDDKKDHVLRVSAAKAFRSPMVAYRTTTTQLHEFAPGLFLVNTHSPLKNLSNEEIFSLEAGYTGKLTKELTIRLDSYYQHFDHMIGYQYYSDPLGLNRYFVGFENVADAKAWGSEFELAYENKVGKLSAWYAYNAFRTEKGTPKYQMLSAQ